MKCIIIFQLLTDFDKVQVHCNRPQIEFHEFVVFISLNLLTLIRVLSPLFYPFEFLISSHPIVV